jgi:hypothetical protein
VGGRKRGQDDAGDRGPEPTAPPPRATPAVDAALGLQRAVGNRRTTRILARGTAQTGASPPLDERTGALEAGLLDPSLAPKIATFRENLDKSLEIAGAISTLTKGKVPVPAPLKLLNRAWKAGCTGRR